MNAQQLWESVRTLYALSRLNHVPRRQRVLAAYVAPFQNVVNMASDTSSDGMMRSHNPMVANSADIPASYPDYGTPFDQYREKYILTGDLHWLEMMLERMECTCGNTKLFGIKHSPRGCRTKW